ncbi:AraC family transcriptional regulator [Luteibacter anthropi]|uniref:Helix-turn-helix transcriptional regulator n=1 Tax=Luteibacter anthropi TaxID=564369 RepID=A0A7X5ZJD2_9GAMM|nr:AraC family transcriptional regulator [Luteibacter anthropi]NII07848.1 helix-turn-helix transcriptional regulator [Luteibacter anthropi]URX61140.1 AraC family transcriptional regulator [Luteibacter anthropi]
MAPHPHLSVRSYDGDTGSDRHEYAQIVLPVRGLVSLDIDGREGRAGAAMAAFVAQDTRHTTVGEVPNRSLIVDLDASLLPGNITSRLAERPFVPMTPAAMALVEYMRITLDEGRQTPEALSLWVPLLLDALTREAPRPVSRLARILGDVENAPHQPWTAADMAARGAMSVSRLHELFRSELDTTPRAWLANLRLRRASEQLVRGDEAIARIATACGFADQSTLTRAMRDAMGITPAAYRRRHRENGPENG